MRRELDRALPAPMIDKIRDGVPARDLSNSGDKAVYKALRSTAASAAGRGWERWEWEELVLDPRSQLGQQARLRKGRRPRTAKEMAAFLDTIWDKATAWLASAPPAWSRAEAAAEVDARIAQLTAVLEDPACALLDADRRILAYACAQARELGTTRVALPKLATSAAAGVGEKSTVNGLKRLDAAGLLVLVERGRPSGPKARKPQANLYELAGAEAAASYLCRGTRPVGPPAQDCGTPVSPDRGTPSQDCGTPTSEPVGTATSRPLIDALQRVPPQRRAPAAERSALSTGTGRSPAPCGCPQDSEASASGETVSAGLPDPSAAPAGDSRSSSAARLLHTDQAGRRRAYARHRGDLRPWTRSGTGPRNRRC